MLVVHPPHVALITRSQVMNDKMAAKGLLVGVWVPAQEIRELRGLVARRQKMTGLATQAKNHLHAVLQRHHLALPLGQLEQVNVQSDLETLRFAQPETIAQKFLKLAYQLGKENRPAGQSVAQFVRLRLDALQLGQELTSIAWGTKKPIPLPPSANKMSDVPRTK